MEKAPLLEREQEYNAVHAFIEERLRMSHCRSLFVFGACGCGKTSTILRAMRCVSHRPMACDKIVGRTSAGGRGSCGSGRSKSHSSHDNSPSPAIVKRKPVKRRRGENESEDAVDTLEGAANGRISVGARDASQEGDFVSSSSLLPAATLRLLEADRRIQCHYVNCADMTSQQLCDAIASCFRVAQPRLDASSRNLLSEIEALPRHVTAYKRRGVAAEAARKLLPRDSAVEHVTEPMALKKCVLKVPLHVLALDEVEYVRAGARGLLSALAALSVEHASQLALVFISNQRELVHVPYMLLKELPFEAYSAQKLERICARIVANVDFTEKERMQVQLSPALIAYIAKKAVHEYSGDVRQVASMSRRLVHTAQQEARDEAIKRGEVRNDETPQRRSGSGITRAGAVPGNTSPASPAAVMTLAQSQKVLRGTAVVSDRVFEYVAGMPEQMLYVLSCLVVLALRQQRDKSLAQSNVAGVTSTTRRVRTDAAAGKTEPGTFAMREVHRMYTALMGQQRFPMMNAAGIASAIDSFADLGIISRPQRCGNEELFSFNGTWSLESMQSALTTRGELLRQERIEFGLDGSENRFSEVLRELKKIAGL
ncbi:hypothetical protein TCSYLVIO_003621 [Trypanosoma cruzi]|nr:hypothetical protein TCSYLVIO_003621 [Trypanosoma cruzi]